jgi:hypothetical protein
LQPACQSHLEKIFCFSEIANHPITPAVHPTKGRIAIVTNAGLDVMDAGCASDEGAGLRTAKACGPDTSVLVSSWREEKLLAGDGGKKADHRGDHVISRKPLRGECRMIPVTSL